MSDRFAEFVRSLAEDQAALDEFNRDPERVMEAVGLSPAEKVLIRHGNQELIMEALGELNMSARFIVRFFRVGV